MATVSHEYSFVIGVDTHSRSHTLAVLAAATGELVDTACFPATRAGVDRAVVWAGRRTGGDPSTLWAIEGVATYGSGLARTAAAAGRQVVEAARMSARDRRGTGKSDPLDARRIAWTVLPLDVADLRRPRADQGVRAALRVLMTARDQMTAERTAHVNALVALLRHADLGVDARQSPSRDLVKEISRWRDHHEDIAHTAARREAVRLAKRIIALDEDLAANHATITALLRDSPAGALLDEPGIGPVTAACALIVWSHPGRVRSEAAFAALAGVNPIPASSGNTTRHRLNRGGDRRLNAALHMAVVSRMTHHPDTIAYTAKRTAEGRTTKEIRRCLKRYLARHIHRTLNRCHTLPASA
ncbi:MAG: IS110 family transposase [Propionibacteriaceae bacterium]|jgi:transposase|nr:IS110 family transposase [Propionibacteriaceae bacterium]